MQARNDAASAGERLTCAKQDATRQIVAAQCAALGHRRERGRRRAAESRARHLRRRVRRLSQRRGLADRRHAGAEPDAGRAERLRRQHRQCALGGGGAGGGDGQGVAAGRTLGRRGRWSAPLARRQPAAPRIGSFRPRRATRHACPRHLRSQSVRTPRLPAFPLRARERVAGLPDRLGRRGLADLRTVRQRAGPGPDRAGSVPADGGADAGGGPRGRPIRPPQDRGHLHGGGSAGHADAGGRRAARPGRQAADLRHAHHHELGARLRGAHAVHADPRRGAARMAAARHGPVSSGGQIAQIAGPALGGVGYGPRGLDLLRGRRAVPDRLRRRRQHEDRQDAAAQGADHLAHAVRRHHLHLPAPAAAGHAVAGPVRRAAGRRRRAAAHLRQDILQAGPWALGALRAAPPAAPC